jgi:Transcriptional regulators
MSATSKVLESVRDDITNGIYVPNKLITESMISKKYNVSKTPAREALMSLCIEGLLEKIPYKGYFVKELDIVDLMNLFEFRDILEQGVIRSIINKLTDSELEILDRMANETIDVSKANWEKDYNELNMRFHLAMAKITGNTYLISNIEMTMNRLKRALMMDLKTANVNDLLATHVKIVRALEERDLNKALAQVSAGIVVIEHRML